MSFEVAGIQELYASMRLLQQKAPVAAAFGMYEGMQEIMVDAKERAPKDTHAMEKSGYVAPPHVDGNGDVEIEAGFGGMSEDYVVRQHEDLTLNHPNGGEARFFSNALDAGVKRLRKTIAEHVNKFMRTRKTYPVAKIVPSTPWEQVSNEHGG